MDSDNDNAYMPTVNFKEPIDLNKLQSCDMVSFEVNFDDVKKAAENKEYTGYDRKMVADNLNFDCLGLHDEDEYADGEPFYHLSMKMKNLDKDGYIRKRILKEGVGDIVPFNSVVYIDYNAYREYDEEPFDSTYLRNKQHRFCVGDGQVIMGLDIAVQTMKFNEKSQFLVAPEYAFGELGCLGRIPKNATILYEVVLAKIVESGAALSFDELDVNEKKEFKDIYKFCMALCEKAKELVVEQQLYKPAIREYNKVTVYLESCSLADYAEQMEQQKLLLRVYTNLAVCYMKVDIPKKCCTACNNAYRICKDSTLSVPTKVYYNNAKALMALNDLKMAAVRLRQAAERNKDSSEIVRCCMELNKLQEQQAARHNLLGAALVSGSGNFRNCVKTMCENLNKDSATFNYTLPTLTKQQQDIAQEVAQNHGLRLAQHKADKEMFEVVKEAKV